MALDRKAVRQLVGLTVVLAAAGGVGTILPDALCASGLIGARTVAYLDLRAGTIKLTDPAVTMVSPPTDSNADGWFESVLRISLDGSPFKKASFVLDYECPPSGWTVNVGDSATNNGFGGDGGTQSPCEAELQILDQTMSVYTNNLIPIEQLTFQRLQLGNGAFRVSVADQYVSWGNPEGVLQTPNSRLLFCLNGEADSGGVNYDVYAAFNRVVADSDRVGLGLGKVFVTLE